MTDFPATSEHESIATEFRQLFDAHASYVWNSLRRLGIPDKDRDDLTQEVFMTVHALLDDYDRGRPFRPWLFGIAYRIALRHRRRLGRGREVPEPSREPVDRTPTAEAALVSKQARELVAAAIEGIELHRRAVFVMKEIDGVDVPDIADALGIPLNTAYSRLRLAREDFRDAVRRLDARKGGTP